MAFLPTSNEFVFWKCLLFMGFPCGSAGKESACNAGDPGSIPGLGRSPGEENGYPLQYYGLGNSMDYMYTVHGVAKSWTRLSKFHFHFTVYISDNTLLCFECNKLLWSYS